MSPWPWRVADYGWAITRGSSKDSRRLRRALLKRAWSKRRWEGALDRAGIDLLATGLRADVRGVTFDTGVGDANGEKICH